MLLTKQSTARTLVFGPAVDETDGFTPETGLTISQADIRLSKNGGAFAQSNNAAGATAMENGYYSVPLDTTDTGTLGILTVALVKETGARPLPPIQLMVVPAAVYDALVNGTGNGVRSSMITADDAFDIYTADIQLTRDGSTMEYTVTWYKNGVRITSGITAPTIQIIARADGSDVLAATAMTQIGSTGSYKYDDATNDLTLGEAYIVVVAATIDAGSREFAKVVTRDS